MKLIRFIVVFLFLFSCEKQEVDTVNVVFYTTSVPVKIFSNFGDFQITLSTKGEPGCNENSQVNKIVRFQLEPGIYKVRYENIGLTGKGEKEITINKDCTILDCSKILGWN